jgi:hypothetical protein
MVARGARTYQAFTIVALSNRVDPFGTLFATAERGLLMGNRGGRFHDPLTRLSSCKHWASRQWICCEIAFRGRKRSIWGNSYTELFFSDDVAALAAGHRPCFECRRADANAFANAWGGARQVLSRHMRRIWIKSCMSNACWGQPNACTKLSLKHCPMPL